MMFSESRLQLPTLLLALAWAFSACTPSAEDSADSADSSAASADAMNDSQAVASLDVYQDPNCGCCGQWVAHVEEYGFAAERHYLEPAELNQRKREEGITAELQSCHTAVSGQGFVFEGHVPAPLMQDFLDEPPAGARGLTVPGMPVGSPGMEVDDRFQPYEVLMVREDGSTEVFASITEQEQQYRQ